MSNQDLILKLPLNRDHFRENSRLDFVGTFQKIKTSDLKEYKPSNISSANGWACVISLYLRLPLEVLVLLANNSKLKVMY